MKLQTEYGEVWSSKMKVAVLYSMMPKDFQEKVLDACAVAWDGTTEAGAGELYEKVKIQIKNLAKARREMQGPKPMEVDRIANSWADWSEDWDGGWRDVEEVTPKDDDHHNHEEANIQYVGKGGGKKGSKGFQGYGYVCGGFGHSQWDCHKGKGKGKSFGKDAGYGKGYSRDGYAVKGYGKGKGGDGKGGMRKACFGCGSTEHIIKDCPKNTNVQRVEEDTPEILFIGNVQNKGALEGWKKMPMKVTLGDFMKDSPRVPIQKTQIRRTGVTKNRFKVLEVDDEEEEVVNVRQVENSERTASAACGFEDGKAKDRVHFVNSENKEEDWASLGVGDIIVDSAAYESCWPVGQGDAFPTKESRRKMLLRTANGGEMQHYGEKEVTFKYDGGENKDPIGLKFHVTDVRKPLLAVRRLVEKGTKSCWQEMTRRVTS